MASWKKDSSGNWTKSGSSKKNYTIVNGQKVEKTETTASAPSTSSDTWNKDTVTLEEAAQQTKDVDSGVINVNTGSTSIETPATTETISLELAAAQTQTESANRVLASEAAQNPTDVTGTVTTSTEYNPNTGEFTKTTVTDTESTYNNLSTIKAGSSIKSAAQLDPITIKKTESQTKATNLKDTALGQLNAYRINYDELKQEETTTSIRVLTAEENAALRKDILGDQTLTPKDTLSSSTSLKSRELTNAYEQQDTDLYNASRLGVLEPVASKYESIVSSLINAEAKTLDKVNVLDRVTGKSINQPFADFVLSAGEALALTPVSTARMAVSAVRDPLGTARASVEQPVKAIIENPAKGLGSLAGSLVGGVALAKVAGVGGSKVSKAVKEENLKIVEREQTTTLNEFKTVPESVKSMPDVTNPVIKMEMPEVGRIRSAESFKVRNSVNNDISTKQSLKSDSFSIQKQTNTNKISKVEAPESSVNYVENTAKANEFKTVSESVKSMPDVTNPVIKMEMPEVGRIKSTESFKVRNSVNNDISAKQSLKSDSFSIQKQTNTNRLAKLEKPESSINYAENTAKANEFKNVPESVKSMPDVTNPVIKMEIPEVGRIRSAESFKVRNSVNNDISTKQSLKSDSFSIQKQTNTNKISKVEAPESSVNYVENTAKLKEFKTDKGTDFTGDFFERVENPTLRISDKLSHTRPKADVMDSSSSVNTADFFERVENPTLRISDKLSHTRPKADVMDSSSSVNTADFFERVENPSLRISDKLSHTRPKLDSLDAPKYSVDEGIVDKYANKREWAKDGGVSNLKPATPEKVLTSELADSLLQTDYFTKKNMQRFIEDERGTLLLDEVAKPKNKHFNPSARESITGEFKQTTIKGRINSFKSVDHSSEATFKFMEKKSKSPRYERSELVESLEKQKSNVSSKSPRHERSELVESLEKQIASKGLSEVPSLKEQLRSNIKSGVKSKSKQILIPAISQKSYLKSEQKPEQISLQLTEQNILQISRQTIMPVQKPKTKQTNKKSKKQSVSPTITQAATPKQTTPQQQEPIIKDPVKPPSEPIKTPSGLPRMPRLKTPLPAEVTPRKARSSSKKGKKSQVKTDTIKNTYIDPMKALGRRKL